MRTINKNNNFSFITQAQYEEIREYEKSTHFDYNELNEKYNKSIVTKPIENVDASVDVIIAGGGPSGMMYGLYLLQRGYSILIIEPQEVGKTSRDWNIAQDELDKLSCILSKSEILSCTRGRIISKGSIQFKDLFTYRSTNLLDIIIDPEKILHLLVKKITLLQQKYGNEFFKNGYYKNVKIYQNHAYVFTHDNKIFKGKLFLHAMGSQDEINYFANYNQPRTYYNVVGAHVRIGPTDRPCGDFLRTLEDASYGEYKQQIIWELFMSEEPKSDSATIYIFSMQREKINLVDFMKYFEQNLYQYVQTDILEVHKPLYGYIELYDNVSNIERSCIPRVYSIGECSVNSVATGCGFAMCIKNLDYIGTQICKILKLNNDMSVKRLNSIKPDIRQLCSISIEQLFKEILIRSRHESIDMPNKHCATIFKIWSLISDEKERTDMLKCYIRPHLFLEALLNVTKTDTVSIQEFFEALRSNNRNLLERLKFIADNYWRLLQCELYEVIKHLKLMVLGRKEQYKKVLQHIKNITYANPIKFYSVYVHIKKQAKSH